MNAEDMMKEIKAGMEIHIEKALELQMVIIIMTTEKGQVGMEITKEKTLGPQMEVSKMVTERGPEAGIRMITIGKVLAIKLEDTKCSISTKIIYFISLVTAFLNICASYFKCDFFPCYIDLLMFNVNKVIDS